MKRIALLLCGALLASLALAGGAEHEKMHEKMMGKSHKVTAEVVSMDAANKTITIKTDEGEKTVPVMGKAVAELKNLKAGQKIVLTCKDNEKGEHTGVTHIEMAKATTANAPK